MFPIIPEKNRFLWNIRKSLFRKSRAKSFMFYLEKFLMFKKSRVENLCVLGNHGEQSWFSWLRENLLFLGSLGKIFDVCGVYIFDVGNILDG